MVFSFIPRSIEAAPSLLGERLRKSAPKTPGRGGLGRKLAWTTPVLLLPSLPTRPGSFPVKGTTLSISGMEGPTI